MPDAKTEAAGAEDAESELLEGDALDLEGLRVRGDVEGLLTLAKACRSGAVPGGRDMKKCYAAYRAAAELGNADAAYAIALFCMSGGVVPQDLKEGTTRLREAAEKGSVPAKVYLGNLYELGIFYKADPEKADVWYRNAARGARVTADAGSPAYARELAELGCARYVLAATREGGDEPTKARLLQRAKAHGYGLKIKDDVPEDRPTLLQALEGADPGAAKPASGKEGERNEKENENEKASEKEQAKPVPKPAPSRAAAGVTAFGYALLFVLAGVGAGYAASTGARELIAHGHPLPGIGTDAHLVFPIVFGAVGVLPTCLVYRFTTVVKAIVMGAAFAGIGWVAWGTGQAALHAHRAIQAGAFGIAGFAAGLFVLGMLGGSKGDKGAVGRERGERRHPTG
jgi:hypothetical protein